MPDLSIPLGSQLVWLVILAIPVACIAWTITHEEVFREPREYCQRQTRVARTLPRRKFFYLFTCEYCFSHYIAAVFLVITRFHMLYVGWRGYLVALFAPDLGGQPVHEHLQPSPPGHQTRKPRDQGQAGRRRA